MGLDNSSRHLAAQSYFHARCCTRFLASHWAADMHSFRFFSTKRPLGFASSTINFLEQASASSRRIEYPQGTIAAPTAKLLRRQPMSAKGLVSRVSPVQTAMRNCTRDEGRSFEVGNQVL